MILYEKFSAIQLIPINYVIRLFKKIKNSIVLIIQNFPPSKHFKSFQPKQTLSDTQKMSSLDPTNPCYKRALSPHHITSHPRSHQYKKPTATSGPSPCIQETTFTLSNGRFRFVLKKKDIKYNFITNGMGKMVGHVSTTVAAVLLHDNVVAVEVGPA